MRRFRVLLAALVGTMALVAPGPVAAQAVTISLGRIEVRVGTLTSQVITVRHTVNAHADVTFWQRVRGRWVREFATTAGRTGYGGMVAGDQRRQGTGTTPMGTYSLITSFGMHPRAAAWKLPYRQIRPLDYWVEDNASAYYNRYRSRTLSDFRWWLSPDAVNGSERLAATPVEYEYAVVIAYNYIDPVRYRGAGIFLHVAGRGATAGCVAAPRWFLADTMARLDPARHPMIWIGK
jgi:L,D-peptidoglycan transpeptidase YkuD (ErfK/YbiS/YcfS/YnhG family)